jgi:hypothetical protein
MDSGEAPIDELASHATYLDLALREHLVMREEMSDLRRQNFNLIVGALSVAGGAALAFGGGIVAAEDGPRGLALLLIAAFADIIALGALGVVNSYKIIEAYVETSAESIRAIVAPARGHSLAAEPLLRYQAIVRDFDTNAFAPNVRAFWLVSFGATVVVGSAVLGIVLLCIAGGMILVLSTSSQVQSAGLVVFAVDIVLTSMFVVGSAWSVRNQTGWGRVAGHPPVDDGPSE